MINSWNSTIWQRDLGNDTCFKAAFIVKNVLENAGSVKALAFNYLTDYSEKLFANPNVFSWRYGLITYQNLPKAGYQAYSMLNGLEEILVESGSGYTVTRSRTAAAFGSCCIITVTMTNRRGSHPRFLRKNRGPLTDITVSVMREGLVSGSICRDWKRAVMIWKAMW